MGDSLIGFSTFAQLSKDARIKICVALKIK
jgi:hypothetical protein